MTLGTCVKIHCASLALPLQQELPLLEGCDEGELTLLWGDKSGFGWKHSEETIFS